MQIRIQKASSSEGRDRRRQKNQSAKRTYGCNRQIARRCFSDWPMLVTLMCRPVSGRTYAVWHTAKLPDLPMRYRILWTIPIRSSNNHRGFTSASIAAINVRPLKANERKGMRTIVRWDEPRSSFGADLGCSWRSCCHARESIIYLAMKGTDLCWHWSSTIFDIGYANGGTHEATSEDSFHARP